MVAATPEETSLMIALEPVPSTATRVKWDNRTVFFFFSSVLLMAGILLHVCDCLWSFDL